MNPVSSGPARSDTTKNCPGPLFKARVHPVSLPHTYQVSETVRACIGSDLSSGGDFEDEGFCCIRGPCFIAEQSRVENPGLVKVSHLSTIRAPEPLSATTLILA